MPLTGHGKSLDLSGAGNGEPPSALDRNDFDVSPTSTLIRRRSHSAARGALILLVCRSPHVVPRRSPVVDQLLRHAQLEAELPECSVPGGAWNGEVARFCPCRRPGHWSLVTGHWSLVTGHCYWASAFEPAPMVMRTGSAGPRG